jgi:mono/diheme cytochrome c family protein
LTRCKWLASLVSALILGISTSALAADRIRGAGLALIWCKSCHVIDRSGSGPMFLSVPSFPKIAIDPNVKNKDIYLRLSASHVRMPKMSLKQRDKEDLISYIRSLRPY